MHDILACLDVVQLVVRLVVQQVHNKSKQWNLVFNDLAIKSPLDDKFLRPVSQKYIVNYY